MADKHCTLQKWIKKCDDVNPPVAEWYEAYFVDGHTEKCARYRLSDENVVFYRVLDSAESQKGKYCTLRMKLPESCRRCDIVYFDAATDFLYCPVSRDKYGDMRIVEMFEKERADFCPMVVEDVLEPCDCRPGVRFVCSHCVNRTKGKLEDGGA